MVGGTAVPLHSQYCVSAVRPSDLDVVGDTGDAGYARRGVFGGMLVQQSRYVTRQGYARVYYPDLDVRFIDPGRAMQLRLDVSPDIAICPIDREHHLHPFR